MSCTYFPQVQDNLFFCPLNSRCFLARDSCPYVPLTQYVLSLPSPSSTYQSFPYSPWYNRRGWLGFKKQLYVYLPIAQYELPLPSFISVRMSCSYLALAQYELPLPCLGSVWTALTLPWLSMNCPYLPLALYELPLPSSNSERAVLTFP